MAEELKQFVMLVDALKWIAKGKPDSGRPFSGEDALRLARKTLMQIGIDDWRRPGCEPPRFYRCTTCGFVIDASYEVEFAKPTAAQPDTIGNQKQGF